MSNKFLICSKLLCSSVCKDFDPFEEQKQQAYFGSQTSILQLAECFGSFTDRAKRSASEKAFSTLSADFERALKVRLNCRWWLDVLV